MSDKILKNNTLVSLETSDGELLYGRIVGYYKEPSETDEIKLYIVKFYDCALLPNEKYPYTTMVVNKILLNNINE